MDMNTLLEIFNTYFLPMIITALAGFFAWLGNKMKNAYDEKVNTDIKRKVAEDVVKFVEQVNADLDGAEKFELAKDKAVQWLNDKNIKVSETEIEVLIESFVKQLFNKDTVLPAANSETVVLTEKK